MSETAKHAARALAKADGMAAALSDDPAAREDWGELGRKMGALEIICGAPLWPDRAALPETGKRLFDAMTADAKEYALMLVDGDFAAANRTAATWAPLLNAFIDGHRILGDEAAMRMCRVFAYYLRQLGDLSQIEGGGSPAPPTAP